MSVFTETIRLIIDASSKGAVSELKTLEKQSGDTATSWDKLSATMKGGLVKGAGALGLAGLAVGAQQLVTGFADAATAANLLSKATNASIEDASKFAAVAGQFGLETNDLIEIFADFQQAAAKNGDELERMGVQLEKNADGTTDWISTSLNFIGAIQEIGDATERNRLLFKYYGEEGAKQIIGLVNSGMDLSKAMEEVSGITEADLKATQEYNAALRDLQGSATSLSQDLGRALIPVFTTVLGLIAPIVDLLGEFDGKTLLLAGSALLLATNQGRVVSALTTMGDLIKGAGDKLIAPLITDFSGLTIEADKSATAIDKNTEAVKRTKTQTFAATAPKLIMGAAVAWEVASSAVNAYNEDIKAVADSLVEINSETAETVLEQQSLWERIGGAISDTFSIEGLRQNLSWGGPSKGDVVGGIEEDLQRAKEASDELTEAQGEYAVAADDAKEAQDALNTALADSTTTSQELRDAINLAGQAQAEKNAIDERAKDVMDAYADSTWRAVDATLAQIDQEFAVKDAHEAVLKAIKEKGSNSDEVAQAVLREADANAKLAEQTAHLAGEEFTAADAHDAMVASLKKSLDNPDLTKEERKAIEELIARITEAQGVAGEGILINGIRFKEGTAQSEVDKLQGEIDKALQDHNVGLAASLQAELDKLKLPPGLAPAEGQTITIDIVDPAGNPIGDTKDINLNVNTTGAAEATTAVGNIPSEKHVTVDVEYVVRGLDEVNGYNQSLDGKYLKQDVEYVVRGLDEVNRYNDDLDNKLITIDVQYNRLNAVPVGPYYLITQAAAQTSATNPMPISRAAGDEWAGPGYGSNPGRRTHLMPTKREKPQEINVYLDGKELKATVDAGKYRVGRP